MARATVRPGWQRGIPVAVLVIALAGAAACSSPVQPAAGAPGDGRATPGATAAAASAAAPSADPVLSAPSHLLVRSWTCLTCIYEPGTIVFDDGLVLHAPGGHYRGRQLTPEGLGWVRARLAESPLAAGPASYGPAPVPGAEPLLRDHTPRRFEMEVDGQRVLVSSDIPAEYAAEADAWEIPDEMRALDALAVAMEEPDAWIPGGMWAGDWTPYVAERFLLFIDPWRDQPLDRLPPAIPDANSVPWPFPGRRIDEVGTPRPGGDPLGERCLVATPAEVARLAAAETAVGVDRPLDTPYVSIEYPWRRGNGTLLVATRWLLPHEPSTCDLPGSGDW